MLFVFGGLLHNYYNREGDSLLAKLHKYFSDIKRTFVSEKAMVCYMHFIYISTILYGFTIKANESQTASLLHMLKMRAKPHLICIEVMKRWQKLCVCKVCSASYVMLFYWILFGLQRLSLEGVLHHLWASMNEKIREWPRLKETARLPHIDAGN